MEESTGHAAGGGMIGEIKKFNLFEKPMHKPLKDGAERDEAICSIWRCVTYLCRVDSDA